MCIGLPACQPTALAALQLWLFCLFVHLSVYLSICLSACMKTCLYACLQPSLASPTAVSSCQPTALAALQLWLFFCLSVCLYVCLSACLYADMSVCLSETLSYITDRCNFIITTSGAIVLAALIHCIPPRHRVWQHAVSFLCTASAAHPPTLCIQPSTTTATGSAPLHEQVEKDCSAPFSASAYLLLTANIRLELFFYL